MKTIKEKAIEWVQKESISKNTYEVERAYLAGAKEVQLWISVNDELPREGVSVLIKNDFGFFGINILENGIWRMCTVEKIAGLLNLKEYELEKFATPTHWRPIELK